MSALRQALRAGISHRALDRAFPTLRAIVLREGWQASPTRAAVVAMLLAEAQAIGARLAGRRPERAP